MANKHAIQAPPASWHDTPGQYIECTCKLTITRSIQDKQQHVNYRLNRNYHEIIMITWHQQHEHNTARTIWAWHEHINLTILACNMMTLYAPFILLGLPSHASLTSLGHHTIISGSNQAWYKQYRSNHLMTTRSLIFTHDSRTTPRISKNSVSLIPRWSFTEPLWAQGVTS